MNVVSLKDFTPGERYDDTPWTKWRLKESATREGTYVQRDEQLLDPVDADPERPLTRNFTSDSATLPAGWYVVEFVDAAGNTQAVDPVFFPARVHAVLREMPTIEDVGAMLRARTKDGLGKEQGTFTENTRVKPDQCAALIGQAAVELVDAIGQDPGTDALRNSARSLCTLGAAMLVELTYYPEQVSQNQSAYAEYERLYERRLKRLIEAVSESGAGGGGDSVAGGGQMPTGQFPAAPDDEWCSLPVDPRRVRIG